MRSKRIRRQISDDHNRWIISYADLMTLLFAFFVVLYAVSNVNSQKYKQVMESVGVAFDVTKVKIKPRFTSSDTLLSPTDKAAPINENQAIQPKKFTELNSELHTLDGDFYKIRGYNGWFELEMKSKALFESGKATLTPEAMAQLSALATILKRSKGPIVIEGYTDNVPIESLVFPSNWELSGARAAAVARVLQAAGIQPTRLSAVGYASQFPVATNTTEEGRSKNRRVILIVAQDYQVGRLLNPKATPKKAKIKVMKEIRTKSGGLKFTQSIETKEAQQSPKRSTTGGQP